MQDPEYAKQYLDKDLDEYMAEAPEATNGTSKELHSTVITVIDAFCLSQTVPKLLPLKPSKKITSQAR